MTILAQQLLAVSQKLVELGLNKGTAGNASVRCTDGFLVTPSGVPVAEMTANSMVYMPLEENIGIQKDLSQAKNALKPSSEWHFHQAILQKRPEINAVIHTHSMFATTLACLHKEIPPFHYMIAVVGGDTIRCAPYALFGTKALSDVALEAAEKIIGDLRGNLVGKFIKKGEIEKVINSQNRLNQIVFTQGK